MKLYKYEEIIKPKKKWLEWFNANGNHDSDGWQSADDWFADMLRCGLITEMSPQEIERQYSHLLSWEDAERQIGRRLDWYNNLDCCVYHDMLMEVLNDRFRNKKPN